MSFGCICCVAPPHSCYFGKYLHVYSDPSIPSNTYAESSIPRELLSGSMARLVLREGLDKGLLRGSQGLNFLAAPGPMSSETLPYEGTPDS